MSLQLDIIVMFKQFMRDPQSLTYLLQFVTESISVPTVSVGVFGEERGGGRGFAASAFRVQGAHQA